MQHIKAMLPDLKLCISTQMIMLQKELTSYMGSSLIPSQVKVALLLNIITKYSYGFQSIVDGKYEEWSSTELSGVVCLQYIFQAIFVTSLEMDYINTLHPNFIGGSKAVEIPLQQQWGTKVVPMSTFPKPFLGQGHVIVMQFCLFIRVFALKFYFLCFFLRIGDLGSTQHFSI